MKDIEKTYGYLSKKKRNFSQQRNRVMKLKINFSKGK